MVSESEELLARAMVVSDPGRWMASWMPIVRYGCPRFDDVVYSGKKYFGDLDRFDRLLRMAPYYKNESFEEEREWRMVLRLEDHSRDQELSLISQEAGGLLGDIAVNVRAASGKLIPFVEIRPPKFDEVLVSVTIGPAASANIEDVELALAISGLENVEVTESTSTYTHK